MTTLYNISAACSIAHTVQEVAKDVGDEFIAKICQRVILDMRSISAPMPEKHPDWATILMFHDKALV